MSSADRLDQPRSLSDVTAEVLRSVSDLMQSEIKLFRVETKAILAQAIRAMVVLALGAAFAIVALMVTADAAVAWLTAVLGSAALAAVLVALAAGVVAAVLLFMGQRQLSQLAMTPEKSLASIERDADLVARKVGQ
ncbi:phage holin family protein [Algihabitans albus]|uniref:phage holin family protein n=1 Tax=Algihabitans albus TaxID=2164067 RepID=UPI000E5D8DFC|nr:phage holin family protein [Algihabitans albus]